MLDLYLIGTAHFDLKGPERLTKLLDSLKPDQIAVEYGQSRVDYIKPFEDFMKEEGNLNIAVNEYAKILNKANKETLKKFLPIADFEYRTTKDYAENNSLPPIILADEILLDADDLTKRMQNENSELNKTMSKYFGLSPEELQKNIDNIYNGNLPGLTDEQIQEMRDSNTHLETRDVNTEATLRNLSGKIVYIAGLAHLYGNQEYYRDKPNLFDRLSDLNPKRYKLIEADSILPSNQTPNALS